MSVPSAAAGRAYLGYCTDAEREQILQLLRVGDDEQARLAADPVYLRNLLARVRADGYGTNDGESNHNEEKGKIGAVAVPIIQGGHAVACLSVIYLCRAGQPKRRRGAVYAGLARSGRPD